MSKIDLRVKRKEYYELKEKAEIVLNCGDIFVIERISSDDLRSIEKCGRTLVGILKNPESLTIENLRSKMYSIVFAFIKNSGKKITYKYLKQNIKTIDELKALVEFINDEIKALVDAMYENIDEKMSADEY